MTTSASENRPASKLKSKTCTAKRQHNSQPGWAKVKAEIVNFDRASLLDLIHGLYAASQDNQRHLHARFGFWGRTYRRHIWKTPARWLWPDVLRNRDASVSKAKPAISEYESAAGDPEGLTELTVYYCEQVAGFCADICNDGESFFDALVRLSEQALKGKMSPIV